jgi:hypothetical protein|tara:strand:- start:19923 stop:20060 length:138 start_codon:yes stop_codon:yes gene_type:complete
MFDSNSFDTNSFDIESWYFDNLFPPSFLGGGGWPLGVFYADAMLR